MNIRDAQGLIEKSILAGRQITIEYTKKGKKEPKTYELISVTSTWGSNFNGIALNDDGKGVPKKFLYEGISKVEITDQSFHPSDKLLEKIRDGSLFAEEDNRALRKGGIKGYLSSLNYVAEPHQRLSKEEALQLFDEIDIPPLDGWERGMIYDIEDGDTFDLFLETDKNASYVTRLFGADAPENSETSSDFILGQEAKTFVEDMFSHSRFCYVQMLGKDAYKRHLVNLLNMDQKNVAIELLRSGLGVPMMGYFEDEETRTKYEEATKEAYMAKQGVWSIDEVHARYKNIISDDTVTKIDVFKHVPDKKSALDRYLKQNPKAQIIRAALNRQKSSEASKKLAENIFTKMSPVVDPTAYDIDALKRMCQIYLDEIEAIDEVAKNSDVVKDCIMHVEDLVDELDLGDGPIKGNFSKGKNKLVYHSDPNDRWYQLCIPEIRFRTVEDARYCGFRKN